MKRIHFLAGAIALLLSGCYNLVVINVGVGNKSASAQLAPLDLRAFCAALTHHTISLTGVKGTRIDQQEATKLCEEMRAEEKGTPQ